MREPELCLDAMGSLASGTVRSGQGGACARYLLATLSIRETTPIQRGCRGAELRRNDHRISQVAAPTGLRGWVVTREHVFRWHHQELNKICISYLD